MESGWGAEASLNVSENEKNLSFLRQMVSPKRPFYSQGLYEKQLLEISNSI